MAAETLVRKAHTVRNGASNHKLDYLTQFQGLLNIKDYQKRIIFSKNKGTVPQNNLVRPF